MGATPAAFLKKLDPKDFMCLGRQGEVFVKKPGSVAGQQFVIADCVDCDIFVCDHCEMVTIDRCQRCRIFIGPCESSIFVRNCVDIKLVASCRQFRTRDCKQLDVLMHCVSQPSIETSSAVRFGCLQYFYFALPAQFEAAGMSVFNNRWSEVYNFTPAKGGYTLLEGEAASPTAFLKPLHKVADFSGAEEADAWRTQSAVPLSLGPAAAAHGSCVLVGAPSLGTDGALELVRRLQTAGLPLARSLEFVVNSEWRAKLSGALACVLGGGGLGAVPDGSRVIVLQVAGGEDSPAMAAEVLAIFNKAMGVVLACAAASTAASAEMATRLFVDVDSGHALG
ncbi:tubulin binding cofactor C-domain-containing protein [Pavlovales sp. CCMP2436]|nr:tubulin binding cofactor C-domain-containing protein [Pavlovales sp. CCMP2436]